MYVWTPTTQICVHIHVYIFLGFIRSFAQFAVLDQNTSNVYPWDGKYEFKKKKGELNTCSAFLFGVLVLLAKKEISLLAWAISWVIPAVCMIRDKLLSKFIFKGYIVIACSWDSILGSFSEVTSNYSLVVYVKIKMSKSSVFYRFRILLYYVRQT